MKKISFLFFVLLSVHAIAQSVIGSYPFSVTVNRTSNIVFPYPIVSADKGSADLLVRQARGVANVLQLKAAKDHMDSTTLSVITSDGKLYPFLITYEAEPKIANLSFVPEAGKAPVILSGDRQDEASLDALAAEVLAQPPFMFRQVHAMKMQLSLLGLYIQDSLLWCRFSIENHSLIPFRPDYIRFFIRDRSGARRTAMQEQELQPVYTEPAGLIRGGGVKEFVCGFTAFTLARDKKLMLEINEQHGGRLLALTLSHRIILHARSLTASK